TAKLDLNRTQILPEDPQDRKAVTKTFHGRRKGGDGAAISIKVTQPSRGRLSDLVELFFPNVEKVVNIAVIFDPHFSMPFMNVKWDSLNGLVEGTLVGTGIESYTAYLQCSGF